MINKYINLVFFSLTSAALLFQIVLIILAILSFDKATLLNRIKVFLNWLFILFYCYVVYGYSMITTRVPSYEAKDYLEAYDKLNNWLILELFKGLICGVFIIMLLTVITYIYEVKLEKVAWTKNSVKIQIINFAFLIFTIVLTYYNMDGLIEHSLAYYK